MTLHRGIDIDKYLARGESPPGEGPGDGSASEEDIFQDRHGYEYSPDPEVGTVPLPESGKYERLNDWARRTDPEYASKLHHDENRRVAQALCSYMELPDAERVQVLEYVEYTDFSDFGNRSIDELILGIIRIVANRTRTWETRISQDERFREAMESLGLDLTDIQRISNALKQRFETPPEDPEPAEEPTREPTQSDEFSGMSSREKAEAKARSE